MGIELVVLDFDGTLTDEETEAAPAIEGWEHDIGEILGFDYQTLQKRWALAEGKVLRGLVPYGWTMGGKIIASATAGPFAMARVISQVLFDEEALYPDPAERDFQLDQVFSDNHSKTLTAFKPDADLFLTELLSLSDVCIITNSERAKVEGKISQLFKGQLEIPVYGNAKKYQLNDAWEAVPEYLDRPGFGRPLFLRRRLYFEILKEVMADRFLTPSEVAVVGDCYELDLLLPEFLGMRIALVPKANTPVCERNAVKAYKKGYVDSDLRKVADYLIARL